MNCYLMLFAGFFWSLSTSYAASVRPSPTTSARGLTIGEQVAPSAVPTGHQTLFPPRSPAVPTPAASLLSPLSSADGKMLLKQFTKAQDSELASLKHRQKAELKELKASQKAQLSEWEAKEKEARHKYFADHKGGPDRRAYIQDYMHRREILLKIQNDERDRRTQEGIVRLDSLKNDQGQRLKEFQEMVSRGERPPARFWPN